jgi:hypothetical protein
LDAEVRVAKINAASIGYALPVRVERGRVLGHGVVLEGGL